MIIRDIFEKPIDRPLEGVIKVGKNTEEAVFEEVTEKLEAKEHINILKIRLTTQ